MRWIHPAVALTVSLVAACDSGARRTADTAAAAPPPATPESPAGGAAGDDTPADLGKSIFTGQAAGGLCYTCHGPDGKGTQLGPNLTDAEWLNTDGSEPGIVDVITRGVPAPKKHASPMPPMGGAQLTPAQIRAVGAYVVSLRAG
jgi:mono/diheme cytochrome c family protein